jgi:photosystem II stability/assembly factor-like uncharacterized protein
MKKLLLITAMIFIGLHSYSQWHPQTIDTDLDLTNVFFLDENLGWIRGHYYDTLFNSIIFRTTNGGETWDSISSFQDLYIYEMLFTDSLTGWITSYSGLYKTEDGGVTLDLVFPGSYQSEFFNEGEGVLLDGDSPFPFYNTDDGGDSWTFIDTLIGDFISGMKHMDFINKDIGYVLKNWTQLNWNFKVLVKTSDGGYTWEYKDCPSNGTYHLFFVDELNGYATEYYANYGNIQKGLYKTTDGADSWTKVYFDYVGAKFFSTPEIGWISSDNTIKYTNNGGLTWDTQYSDSLFAMDLFFNDSLNGWAVGKKGLILHTTNGGGTTTSIIESRPLTEQIKIYPNPVLENVTFEFVLEKQETISINVYNALGERVATPTCQAFSQGFHQLEWNASYLDEGIYFCNFNIGKFSTTKRFIKK